MNTENMNDKVRSAAHQRGQNQDNSNQAGLAPPSDAPNVPGLRAKRAYREYKAGLVPGAPCSAPCSAPCNAHSDDPWRFRGYLPHRDEIGIIQLLTFRLADSLPQEKLRELEEEIKKVKTRISTCYTSKFGQMSKS